VKGTPTVPVDGGAPASKVTEVGLTKQILGDPLVGPPQYWFGWQFVSAVQDVAAITLKGSLSFKIRP
jgi:hypothetical protein